MRSLRCNLPHSVPAEIKGGILGIGGLVKGRLIAVESYVGCSPTFTWIADSGHIFCFVPPHAFSTEVGTPLEHCVDMDCPPGPIDVSDLGLEGPGHAKVGERIFVWKKYIATVDWYEQNKVCHLVQTAAGVLVFVRNPRFQVGGEKYDPPTWKKLRETWSVGGPRPGG